MFKRHLKPLLVFVAVEAVTIGGIFYALQSGEAVKVGISIAAFCVAQYIIYTAWRDIRNGEEWDEGGPRDHGDLKDF